MFKYCRMTEGKGNDTHTDRNGKAVTRVSHDKAGSGPNESQKHFRLISSSQEQVHDSLPWG